MPPTVLQKFVANLDTVFIFLIHLFTLGHLYYIKICQSHVKAMSNSGFNTSMWGDFVYLSGATCHPGINKCHVPFSADTWDIGRELKVYGIVLKCKLG